MTITRTIVAIEEAPLSRTLVTRVVKGEPGLPAGADQQGPLTLAALAPPPLADEAALKQYGAQLRDALAQHPGVQQALARVFHTPAGQPKTLYFEIRSRVGESVRWEALCDDAGNFVALDPRYRLGRLLDPIDAHDAGGRTFAPPLKVLALLSAARRDAAPEFRAIATAVGKARANGFPVEARIFLGQQALHDAVATEVANGQWPGVSVAVMPEDELAIEDELAAWQPHVVHVFCHGSVAFGSPILEFATIVDHDLDRDAGSIELHVETLESAAGIRNAWFVVLNCCEGASPDADSDLGSLAHRLVARGNVPGVVGMQAAVPVADAHAFAERLYPALFDLLAEALASPTSAPVAIEFAPALLPARRQVRARQATNGGHGAASWTLPVLYAQRAPLQVWNAPAVTPVKQEELRERANTIANLLRTLPPDTPMHARDALLALLDTSPIVPPALRPDRFGVIGGG